MQTEAVVLEWGKSLISFSPRLSSASQTGLQVTRSYSDQLGQAIVAAISPAALAAEADALVERLGSGLLEQLKRMRRSVVRDRKIESFVDAAEIAKAMLRQVLEGLYEGSGSCIGTPALRAGEQIEIRGLGKRYSGRYTLHRVTHTMGSGGYQTQFDVSQRQNLTLLSSLRSKIAESPSPHRQPEMLGLVVATVTRNVDLQGKGRVQVRFDDLSDSNESP